MIECAGKINSGKSRRESVEIIEEHEDQLVFQAFAICRLCSSSAGNLTPFEDNTHLMQLFQNITDIDLRAGIDSSKINNICSKCNNELEKISSFISSSIRNDQKLEDVIGTENTVQTENYSNPIDTGSSKCHGTSTADSVKVNSFSRESDEIIKIIDIKEKVIDIKEEIIDRKLPTSSIKISKSQFRHYPEEKPFESVPSEETSKEVSGSRIYPQIWEKPFTCDSCRRSYSRKRYFERHLQTHARDMPFKCDLCKKGFIRKRYLKWHISTHPKEYKFLCACCDKGFNNKCSLRQHILAHAREKTFNCHSCEKGFNEKQHFQQHLLTHTEENLFRCECCEKSFLLKQSLQKHYAHSHKKVCSE